MRERGRERGEGQRGGGREKEREGERGGERGEEREGKRGRERIKVCFVFKSEYLYVIVSVPGSYEMGRHK